MLWLGIVEAELTGELCSNAGELATTEHRQEVAAVNNAVLLLTRQALLDQPLPTSHKRLVNLAAEASIPSGYRRLRHKGAIEPSGSVAAELLRKRQSGKDFDGDWMGSRIAPLVGFRPIQAIGRNHPGAVGLPLD